MTTSPTSSTVREHASASFQCKAEGLPTPVVEWTRTGGSLTSTRHVIQSDNTLLLTNVTYIDHGTYTCSAVSVLGNDSVTAYLTVQGECLLLNNNNISTAISSCTKFPKVINTGKCLCETLSQRRLKDGQPLSVCSDSGAVSSSDRLRRKSA